MAVAPTLPLVRKLFLFHFPHWVLGCSRKIEILPFLCKLGFKLNVIENTLLPPPNGLALVELANRGQQWSLSETRG